MKPYKTRDIAFALARKLRQDGFGYRSIAHQLGDEVSWGTVRRWVSDISSDTAYDKSLPYRRRLKSWESLLTRSARRKYLIREFGHRCSVCKLDEWMGSPIPVEIHHIDGNGENNSLDNCVLICPNCHAQTDTYKGKNIGAVA